MGAGRARPRDTRSDPRSFTNQGRLCNCAGQLSSGLPRCPAGCSRSKRGLRSSRATCRSRPNPARPEEPQGSGRAVRVHANPVSWQFAAGRGAPRARANLRERSWRSSLGARALHAPIKAVPKQRPRRRGTSRPRRSNSYDEGPKGSTRHSRPAKHSPRIKPQRSSKYASFNRTCRNSASDSCDWPRFGFEQVGR